MTAPTLAVLAKVALAALVLLFPVTALAQDAAPAASAATGGTLTANLNGDSEVGHDGDPDGTATATLRIEPGKLCYEVAYRRLAPVDAAHIHQGEKGKNGPPVVILKLDRDENLEGCTPIAPDVANALLANPEAYYVDVKTTELKNGAIRGQLAK